MKIRLYLDEDAMERDLVVALQARGVDVTTALTDGLINLPDAEHLIHATAQGRVLVSFNVADYYALHSQYLAAEQAHAGLVLSLQQQYSVGERMRRLLRLIATKSAEEMRNQVAFLSAWG